MCVLNAADEWIPTFLVNWHISNIFEITHIYNIIQCISDLTHNVR